MGQVGAMVEMGEGLHSKQPSHRHFWTELLGCLGQQLEQEDPQSCWPEPQACFRPRCAAQSPALGLTNSRGHGGLLE